MNRTGAHPCDGLSREVAPLATCYGLCDSGSVPNNEAPFGERAVEEGTGRRVDAGVRCHDMPHALEFVE